MVTVIKRNGDAVPFDKDKIVFAIAKAYDGQRIPRYVNRIAGQVERKARKLYDSLITVEEIQDIVSIRLMKYDKKTAEEYIKYRYKRQMVRNASGDFFRAVSEKLNASNIENQNANVDERSFGGRIGEASRVMTKSYSLKYCLSDMAKYNHENNLIYVHDLDSYPVGSHNCLSVPFDDLLAKGFNTRQTDVRPANSINTAFQLVAVLFQLQSLQQFGGVSATHLDWTMVPYVRKSFVKHFNDGTFYFEDAIRGLRAYGGKKVEDISINDECFKSHEKAYRYAMDMTQRELKQAVEGMYHNLK